MNHRKVRMSTAVDSADADRIPDLRIENDEVCHRNSEADEQTADVKDSCSDHDGASRYQYAPPISGAPPHRRRTEANERRHGDRFSDVFMGSIAVAIDAHIRSSSIDLGCIASVAQSAYAGS